MRAGCRRRRVGALAGALAFTLLCCALKPSSSLALRVTLGTPTASFNSGPGRSQFSCATCTFVQLDTPGFTLAAPANGVITSWRVIGEGALALRVLRPSAGSLMAVSTTPASPFSSTGPAVFPVHVPILAGDRIGVDLLRRSPESKLTGTNLAGAMYSEFQPGLLDGTLAMGGSIGSTALDLNADVDLAPLAGSLAVTSGSTAGGTAVAITGTYLDGVTSVLFGGAPAAFTLGPAGQLLVTTPAQAAAGKVDVVLAGPGGTSTLTGAFTYLAPTTPPPPSAATTPAPSTVVGPSGLPVIKNLSLSPSVFSASSGTRLSYSISLAATTRFDVLRPIRGRRVHGRGGAGHFCQPALNPVPTAKRCTQYISLGHFEHVDQAGATVIPFTGNLGGQTLPAGSYRLRAVARAASGRVSAAATHAFRIF